MRAIRFDGQNLVLDPKAAPLAPAEGEALVRPIRMGVSAFDAMVAAGGRPEGLAPGQILGSEMVGVVESLGQSADGDLRKRWEGKRVVASTSIACTRCDMCRAGLQAHCRDLKILGVRGGDGCMAESVRLPLRNLYEAPANVTDDQAVLAGPLSGALHAAHLIRIEGKPYVTVLGDGADALLAAQIMVRLNASVRVLGNIPDKFGLCERWGIKHRHTAEVGRRSDQDVVVDCTGTSAGLSLAFQLIRPRGKVVLRSSGAGVQVPAAALVEHEIELLGARAGSIPDALAVLARGEVDVLPLITRRAKLSDGPVALASAASSEQIKVILAA